MNFIQVQQHVANVVAKELWDYRDMISISVSQAYLTSSNYWTGYIYVRDILSKRIVHQESYHIQYKYEDMYEFKNGDIVRENINRAYDMPDNDSEAITL